MVKTSSHPAPTSVVPDEGSRWCSVFARCADFRLFLALAALFCSACSAGEEVEIGERAYGQGVYIPAHWEETRQIEGHRIHVVDEKVPCSDCHQLTEKTIGPVSPEACRSCHAAEASIVHAEEEAIERFGKGVRADCTSCHVFTLHATVDGPHAAISQEFDASECLRCHADQQGDLAPVTVHSPADCLSCHQPHERDVPVSAPCNECHEELSTTHASTDKSILQTCTTCHQSQHAAAEAAIETCATCHANEEPRIPTTALFEGGHGQCIGCHRPHAFETESATPCSTCHEDQPVLAEARVAAHRECTSCHNPHDVRSASADACSNCHQNIAPNHPRHQKVGTCTGCHDPHPATRTSQRVRDCSTCHHEAARDDSFHEGVACRSCHAPHKFLLGSAGMTLCGQCHSENVHAVDSHPGHDECTSCHTGLPHRPERMNAPCSSCHQEIARKARKGHTDCQSCHDPHGTPLRKECGQCHQEEKRSAPLGHASCTNCHDQHSGSHEKAACSTCHQEEARTPHGRIATDCANCHRPHGPDGQARPPACSTCHQSTNLPGLHHLRPHDKCSTCHTEHGESVTPERPACLSCHQDKRNHFPEAPTCSSCHLFTPTK